MSDTFSKIEELREQAEGNDPETVRILDGARDILKKALIKENLAKHPGVSMLLTMCERKLKGINGLLQEDEELTDKQRARWFGEKRAIETFIRFFSVAERNVEVINNDITKRYSEKMV